MSSLDKKKIYNVAVHKGVHLKRPAGVPHYCWVSSLMRVDFGAISTAFLANTSQTTFVVDKPRQQRDYKLKTQTEQGAFLRDTRSPYESLELHPDGTLYLFYDGTMADDDEPERANAGKRVKMSVQWGSHVNPSMIVLKKGEYDLVEA